MICKRRELEPLPRTYYRLHAEKPQGWEELLARLLADFVEVREARLAIAETPGLRLRLLAFYLNAHTSGQRLRELRLRLIRIFDNESAPPLRFITGTLPARGEFAEITTMRGLMLRMRDEGTLLYQRKVDGTRGSALRDQSRPSYPITSINALTEKTALPGPGSP